MDSLCLFCTKYHISPVSTKSDQVLRSDGCPTGRRATSFCVVFPQVRTPKVRTGLDRLPEMGELLRGLRVGLIANPSSVDASFRHAREIVAKLPGVTLAALFAPEHGFDAVEQDLIEIADGDGPIPVHSLYGPTRRPTAAR